MRRLKAAQNAGDADDGRGGRGVIQAIQIVIGGLLQGAVFAMLALGFSLVYRVTGVINLAQGGFCILGALLMYTLQVSWSLPIPIALLGALAGTILAGAALGYATFVPALRRLSTTSILVMTAGLLTLLQGLLLLGWSSQPYALPPISGEAPLNILGIRIPTQALWIVAALTLIIVSLWYLLAHTKLGLALRACAENRLAARLMGIDVPWMTLLSFVLAAAIAGIGGIAVAPITSIEFDTGGFFTNFGFISSAVGGLSAFAGSVFGGLILGVSEQLAAGYISSLFANGLALALLLVMLIWRPNGLFSAGPARRQDVRDDQRIHRAIVRLDGRSGVIFGFAAAAFVLILPLVLPDSGILNSLVITGILFIAVMGLDVVMGYAGQVSLGHGGFMAIGGYGAAILATTYEWPPLLGIAVGIISSLFCAIALSLVTMRLRGHFLALATLAFGLMIDSLTVGLTGLTGGPSGLVGIPSFSIGSYVFASSLQMYYLVAALMFTLGVMLYGGIRSGFGRALQAVRTDQTAAAALGVNVPRYKLAAMCIAAMLASLAGSLYAFYFHFLSPDMVGMTRSFEMIAMLVAGGEGTLVGPLLGVALLTLAPTVFQPLAVYKTFVEGLLLVMCFLWLPEGMFGTVAVWLKRLSFRSKSAAVETVTL